MFLALHADCAQMRDKTRVVCLPSRWFGDQILEKARAEQQRTLPERSMLMTGFGYACQVRVVNPPRLTQPLSERWECVRDSDRPTSQPIAMDIKVWRWRSVPAAETHSG